jgi:hypothetical protein
MSIYNPITATPLADADVTVDPNADVASEYVCPSGTLSTNRTVTLDATSLADKYVVRVILESGNPSGNLIVKNTSGTTLATLAGGGPPKTASFYVSSNLFLLLSTYAASVIDSATTTTPGLMPAADKDKLNHIYRPLQGTALTDADQTLQPGTDAVSEYVQTTALGATRTKTLGTTSVVTGTLLRIVRADTAAHIMVIVNGGGAAGTLFTFASAPSQKQGATFYYNGADWVLVGFEYLTVS